MLKGVYFVIFCLSLVLSFKESSQRHKHQQATQVTKLVTEVQKKSQKSQRLNACFSC